MEVLVLEMLEPLDREEYLSELLQVPAGNHRVTAMPERDAPCSLICGLNPFCFVFFRKDCSESGEGDTRVQI